MMVRRAVPILLAVLLAAAGCGGSGASEQTWVCYEDETRWATAGAGAVASDLTGSYYLSGFNEDWSTVFGNHIRTVTEADWDSFSGSLDIGSGFVFGAVTLTGRVPLLTTESAWSQTTWYLLGGTSDFAEAVSAVTWQSPSAGVITYASGYAEAFAASGDVLTVFSSGCIPLEPTEEDVPAPLSVPPLRD